MIDTGFGMAEPEKEGCKFGPITYLLMYGRRPKTSFYAEEELKKHQYKGPSDERYEEE